MEMVESLEAALDDFDGTLMMVSHDRAFIEGLADRIWLIEDGQFYEYPGWEDYKAKHKTAAQLQAEATAAAPRPQAAAPAPRGKGLWHLKREVEALEAEVAALEAELDAAHTALGSAGEGADYAALGQAAHDVEVRLEQKMQQWSDRQAEVEARGG